MQSVSFRWAALLVSALVGCGPSPSASSPGSQSGEKPNGEKPGQAASLEEQRAGFIDGCVQRVPGAPDYCQCSWDLLLSMFSEAELAEPDADPRRMLAYKNKLGPACGDKIPEEFAHKKFLKDCTRGNDKLGAYCDCAWPELRKKLSVADLTLADHASEARIVEAKRGMVKACEKSLPESVPRDDFIAGCLKSEPDARPFCECAWKQLRGAYSAAELAAGLADIDAVKPKIQATCAKLHPAAKQ